LHSQLLLGSGRDFHDVAGAHLVGRHVHPLAVHQDAVVAHDLARFGPARSESHAVRDRIQARLEDLQEPLAGHALAARRLGVGLAELALEEPVDAAQLLLFTQLLAEVRHAAAALLPVLPRRVAAALDRAFVGEALLALEEQLFPFAAALPAFGVQVSGHAYPLYAPSFRRPAAVVGDGRHVGDAADLQAQCVERADRGLPAGAGPFDAPLGVLDAALLRRAARLLGGHLGGERRRFARAFETGCAGGRPRQRVALAVGDRDDGVVEGSVDVGDALG